MSRRDDEIRQDITFVCIYLLLITVNILVLVAGRVHVIPVLGLMVSSFGLLTSLGDIVKGG